MNDPIADFHCDLLCYLIGNNRTPFDPQVRCSIPQLSEGNVKLQTLAVYTATEEGSTSLGAAQIDVYQGLLSSYSNYLIPFYDTSDFLSQHKISVALAIENASALFEETDSLGNGFTFIKSIEENIAKIQYLSFTWNTSNRFGGGSYSKSGITADGIELLLFMDQRGIAVDLSHASDALAYDVLNEIDRRNLEISVVASHSNARSVTNAARNLPDELIKEIIAREGVIGFNFIRQFLGSRSGFVEHLQHFLELGAENHLCFGADFFYGLDVPKEHRKLPEDLFFPEYDHAGVYAKVVDLWKKTLGLDETLIKKICYQNLLRFLSKNR